MFIASKKWQQQVNTVAQFFFKYKLLIVMLPWNAIEFKHAGSNLNWISMFF